MGEEALAPLGSDALAASDPPMVRRHPGFGASPAGPVAAPPPAPPSFADDPPVPWATAEAEVASGPIYGNRPWGLIDPGAVIDGLWSSRGYASSSRRATVLRLALAVQIAFEIGLVLFERGLVFANDSGVRYSPGVASILRGVLGAVGPVSAGIAIVVMVALFAWISRVVENVPALTGRTPARSPREAIGWWFVPVAGWVVPYMIVRDAAWRLRVTADDTVVRLILPWWILRTGAAIAGLALGRLLRLDDSTNALLSQAILVVEALGDAMLIAVVAGITRNERVQASRLDFGDRRGHEWPRFASLPPDEGPVNGIEDEFVGGWRPRLATRRAASRPDDPLGRASDEGLDDYRDRILAALEAEAVER